MTDHERAEQLIQAINALARAHDAYEYGLPVYHAEAMAQMSEAVLAAFRDVKAEVWEEARSLLIAQQCKQPFYGSAIYKQVVVDFARWIDKLVDMFAARAAALREGRDVL